MRRPSRAEAPCPSPRFDDRGAAEELLVLADPAVLVRNPAPAPDWHGRVGRNAVFLFGINIGRLHLAAMPPVVAEVEYVFEGHPHVEAERAERHAAAVDHLRL